MLRETWKLSLMQCRRLLELNGQLTQLFAVTHELQPVCHHCRHGVLNSLSVSSHENGTCAQDAAAQPIVKLVTAACAAVPDSNEFVTATTNRTVQQDDNNHNNMFINIVYLLGILKCNL